MSFYFAISGAIISYYLSHMDSSCEKIALYLPFIMGVGLLIFFFTGAILSLITRNDVFELRDRLKLQVAPETGVLTLLLFIFSIVLLTCIGGLAYILWFDRAL